MTFKLALLDHFFSRAVAHRIFWSKSLNRTNSSSFLEAQSFNPAFFYCSFPSGPWTLPSYSHCRQECSSCHLPGMFFLGFRSEVQQSASSHQLLTYICQKGAASTPGTSWIGCTLLCCPSSRHQSGQVSHVSQSLQSSSFLQFSEEGLI